MFHRVNVITFNNAKQRKSEGSAIKFLVYFTQCVCDKNKTPAACAKLPRPPSGHELAIKIPTQDFLDHIIPVQSSKSNDSVHYIQYNTYAPAYRVCREAHHLTLSCDTAHLIK
ncbi:hypothetical protein E2C01_031020 [Portunus trituberculatus]|uniref:Uncharacterized protein n=1 Tax=Portunus trituberculatus TaxID=210409 RepID=A0A5B7EWH5_PORTR|nr:hypothetical protein [Portunus trituberculatus]